MSKQRTVSKQRTAAKQQAGGKQVSGGQAGGKQRPTRSAPSKQRRDARRQARSKPVRRRGFAGMRRSRRQHLGIAAAAVGTLAVIWLFADWQLAIGLTALVLLVLPAFVVLTMGRRY